LTTLAIRDQEERTFGVAGAGDDEQISGRLVERRPALVDAANDPDDLKVSGRRDGGADRRLVNAGVERDEGSRRVLH
jgi:hypothetical protein